MSRTMKAIRKPRAEPGLVIEDVPIPEPGPHDVLVRVEATSICGTDLHIYRWDDWSRNRLKPPLTIGHEFAGTVVEIGNLVERVFDHFLLAARAMRSDGEAVRLVAHALDEIEHRIARRQ